MIDSTAWSQSLAAVRPSHWAGPVLEYCVCVLAERMEEGHEGPQNSGTGGLIPNILFLNNGVSHSFFQNFVLYMSEDCDSVHRLML